MQDETQVSFDGVEHVIPQAFGTFGSATPTLDCVCDECNDYFSKHLDRILARESIEGVTRYQYERLRSSDERIQRHLTITLPDDDPELGMFAGTKVFIDGTTGMVVPLTYVTITDKNSDEEITLLRDEIDSFDASSWVDRKTTMQIRAQDIAEHDEIVAKLKEKGFSNTFNEAEALDADVIIRKQPPVTIEGQINRTIRRPLAKILFNFTAKYVGIDEVMKSEWNAAREFIRHDQGDLGMETQSKPFWDDETEISRLSSTGYNVIVQNCGKGTLGSIEFFNLLKYDILLVPNYEIDDEKAVGYRFEPDEEPIQAMKWRKDSGIAIVRYDHAGRPIVIG